jgi:hypothetical protein
MASQNLLKKFGKTQTSTSKDGGYKNLVYFSPVDTFDDIKSPAADAVLGDKYKITDDHTLLADEGFISMLCKLNSVTTKSESVGEDDAMRTKHTAEFIWYGDSAEHLAQAELMRENPAIWLLKDQDCINATDYVQFGDSCNQPTFKFEFTGNTTKEGMKEYKGTLEIIGKKYFYSGVVTEKP